jgi:ABC-type sugar transport system permease subunit
VKATDGVLVGAPAVTRRAERSRAAIIRKTLRRPQFWFGAAALIPALVWYSLFAYLPILGGLYMAVVNYDFAAHTVKGFVGLRNFQLLLMDPLLFTALNNTALLAIMEFACLLPIGIFVATCLVNVRRGENFYQAAIFLPVVVSLVAVSLLFLSLMDPNTGLFNQLLRSFGLPTSQFLSETDSALPSVAAINIWKSLGFVVLLLASGMRNIPLELYDAARVDGVNEWQRFRFITVPLLGHTLLLVMVLLGIGVLQEYTSVAVLTQGGPGTATYVLNILIVTQAFSNMRLGVAAAAAVVEFVLVFIISMVQLRLLRPNWSY